MVVTILVTFALRYFDKLNNKTQYITKKIKNEYKRQTYRTF